MMGVLGYAAVACTCASLVFSIISIALPYWLYHETSYSTDSRQTIYIGLWTACYDRTISGKTESNCESIGTYEDFLKATRALEIIGLLLVAGAGIIGALKLLDAKENQISPNLPGGTDRKNQISPNRSGGTAIFAGICMILGAIIYAVKLRDLLGELGSTLHAGFGLAIVSGVIAFVAGALLFASDSN